jgi:hypothetical protein
MAKLIYIPTSNKKSFYILFEIVVRIYSGFVSIIKKEKENMLKFKSCKNEM